jgi:hypothetical protein
VPGAQTSCWTGEANTNALAGLAGAYDAAKYCASLAVYGHDDWYLPSQYELAVLYQNSSVIGGFQSAYYWSSSENAANSAWFQRFSIGSQNFNSKSVAYFVRCVRR